MWGTVPEKRSAMMWIVKIVFLRAPYTFDRSGGAHTAHWRRLSMLQWQKEGHLFRAITHPSVGEILWTYNGLAAHRNGQSAKKFNYGIRASWQPLQ